MTIHRLAMGTLLLTFLLIVFGGYVASSESGMGCGPDWPLCNGVLVPVLHGETLIEYTHRVIGALLAVLSALLWWKIRRSQASASVRRAADGMALLLVLQILLGALVVVLDLPAIVVTLHLLIAFAFMALLLYLWRTTRPADRPASRPIPLGFLIQHVNLILLLCTITIALGAYIKHQSYGLACDWLTCRESWLPVGEAQIWQTLHRLFALATAAYTALFAAINLANADRRAAAGLRNRLVALAAAVLLQLLIGVAAVATNLDIAWAVIHLAAATALFAVLAELRIWLGSIR